MPTENRSSNTEMVSVPREPSAQMLDAARNTPVPMVYVDSMRARQDLEFSARYKAAIAQCTQPDPTTHPNPIAWMVGTAIWWTKEEAERDAAEVGLPVVGLGPMTGSSVPAVSIPDGYCLMPRRLTAENGAKALMLGEFKLEVTRECPECLELDEPAEGCEICDGEGEYAQRHTIPWDLIKFIYSEAVKGLALKPNTAR
ncbi:TPA: hypothetical protein QEM53_003738 [Pseudomonas putida]|uniref:hypothetical protein n=1 Tax=Pseudomonas putida TaxID=303 RepID=UPI00235C6BA8|nr:hypothetical protein [Pseudomonas putida]GLO19226.1 hypothetical protein PPUJ20188_26220 [Pseudomonas putida]HDS0995026.1 hypothetical protein [Pseudomonas putida]HDS1762829.1 hypothetical protein [Pseudomonas putida]